MWHYAEYCCPIATEGANKIRPATHDFWGRVKKLFFQIDSLRLPDKHISREEFRLHFKGNTAEADR